MLGARSEVVIIEVRSVKPEQVRMKSSRIQGNKMVTMKGVKMEGMA
jgi:hypothetical protein